MTGKARCMTVEIMVTGDSPISIWFGWVFLVSFDFAEFLFRLEYGDDNARMAAPYMALLQKQLDHTPRNKNKDTSPFSGHIMPSR